MGTKTIKEFYQKQEDIGLTGWISLEEARFLKEQAEKLNPGDVYLEIGVAYGRSLSIVAKYAFTKEVYGVDILNWKEREDNLKKLKVKANFIEGNSQALALTWKKPIDLLFIDGDHTYEGVVKDIDSWLPKVKDGGMVMFHDYCEREPGVMQAVQFIQGHYRKSGIVGTIYWFTKDD